MWSVNCSKRINYILELPIFSCEFHVEDLKRHISRFQYEYHVGVLNTEAITYAAFSAISDEKSVL